MRDFDVEPYSKDEARIAVWLSIRGVGGGDDPIGFLLASYEYLVAERNELQRKLSTLKVERVQVQPEDFIRTEAKARKANTTRAKSHEALRSGVHNSRARLGNRDVGVLRVEVRRLA